MQRGEGGSLLANLRQTDGGAGTLEQGFVPERGQLAIFICLGPGV